MNKHKAKHDNKTAITMKNTLKGIITDMANDPSDFVVTPGVDFTRKRKLDFETIINLILSMKGGAINKELYDYFGGVNDTVTVSAFVQQRGKLKTSVFEYLFNEFNDQTAYMDTKTYDGYRLLAVDGSDINIATNPESETYFQQGFNQFHLNAIYDVMNKIYFDAVIQPAPKEHEPKAAIEMLERHSYKKTILIADRGYESVNFYEHLNRIEGLDYLIRIKNAGTKETRELPMENLDVDISFELRTTQTNEDKKAFAEGRAKWIPGKSKFGKEKIVLWDFESPFMMRYRLVRFEISPNNYETIVTSLDRFRFPPEKIKELYHLRWGIETSFRELKYAIGVVSFHAKKEDFIQQEIFAMLTMYNFCERITMSVVIEQSDGRKYIYQVNFTMAIHICRDFFSLPSNRPPPDVFALISRYILPVREGRGDKRKMRSKTAITFTYRIAA